MSTYTGRMGSPPKRHWYQTGEGEALLIVAAILVIGLLAAVVYTLATPTVSTELTTAPAAANALLEQRRGEWNTTLGTVSPAQSAYHEQRVGEWTAGQVRIPPVLPMQIDPEWLSRMQEAQGAGVR